MSGARLPGASNACRFNIAHHFCVGLGREGGPELVKGDTGEVIGNHFDPVAFCAGHEKGVQTREERPVHGFPDRWWRQLFHLEWESAVRESAGGIPTRGPGHCHGCAPPCTSGGRRYSKTQCICAGLGLPVQEQVRRKGNWTPLLGTSHQKQEGYRRTIGLHAPMLVSLRLYFLRPDAVTLFVEKLCSQEEAQSQSWPLTHLNASVFFKVFSADG